MKRKTGFNTFEMWLCGWADILQGIIWVLSLGFYCPNIALRAAKGIARRRDRRL